MCWRYATDVRPPHELPECAAFARQDPQRDRRAPTTHENHWPAPFRYLLLHKHEPNRRQIGRMIERINTTGIATPVRAQELDRDTPSRQLGPRLRSGAGQRLSGDGFRRRASSSVAINRSRRSFGGKSSVRSGNWTERKAEKRPAEKDGQAYRGFCRYRPLHARGYQQRE